MRWTQRAFSSDTVPTILEIGRNFQVDENAQDECVETHDLSSLLETSSVSNSISECSLSNAGMDGSRARPARVAKLKNSVQTFKI